MIDTIQKEFNRRLYEESIPRIEKCLDLLQSEQIWKKPNEHLNSIGNLILHLCGNVRQWIGSGLGGQPDNRHRDKEFSSQEKLSSGELKEMMQDLKNVTDKAFKDLTQSGLYKEYEVQGFKEKGLSIVIHVIEHFSYHTGQIALLTKLWTNKDLRFYEGIDLNVTA